MMLPPAISLRLTAMRNRWQSLPLRDRRALAALAAFFVLAGGWLLVVSPALDYARNAQESLATAQADLAWMQANAAVARQAGANAGGGVPPGQSLLTLVNASARAANVNLQRFEPDGEHRVRVTLEQATFTDVMAWIVTLERDYGLVVESFNADQQPQPGIVNIRMTLGRPS